MIKAIKSFQHLHYARICLMIYPRSISKTASTADKSSKVHVVKEEVKMLEQIVEAEATGEDIIGKILVANVIFNRMADDEFPDKVKEVIFQKVGDDYQFSPISDKRYWR